MFDYLSYNVPQLLKLYVAVPIHEIKERHNFWQFIQVSSQLGLKVIASTNAPPRPTRTKSVRGVLRTRLRTKGP